MSHAEDTVHRIANDQDGVCFVISSEHCWLPGSYADERAAWYAFSFDDAVLRRLQDKANENEDCSKRLITLEMLVAAREEERAKCLG